MQLRGEKTALNCSVSAETWTALDKHLNNFPNRHTKEYIVDYAIREYLERANPIVLEMRRKFVKRPLRKAIKKRPLSLHKK